MTKWETVGEKLERFPVDGGFLYRSFFGGLGSEYSAPVFVPAPPVHFVNTNYGHGGSVCSCGRVFAGNTY